MSSPYQVASFTSAKKRICSRPLAWQPHNMRNNTSAQARDMITDNKPTKRVTRISAPWRGLVVAYTLLLSLTRGSTLLPPFSRSVCEKIVFSALPRTMFSPVVAYPWWFVCVIIMLLFYTSCAIWTFLRRNYAIWKSTPVCSLIDAVDFYVCIYIFSPQVKHSLLVSLATSTASSNLCCLLICIGNVSNWTHW